MASNRVFRNPLVLAALLFGAGTIAAQSTPVAAPFVENFDSYATGVPLVATPGATGLGSGWDYVSFNPSATSSVETGSPILMGMPPHPIAGNGAQFLALSATGNASGGMGGETLALHINGIASNALGSGFRIGVQFFGGVGPMPDDVIALVDGVTPGAATTASGAPSPLPGYGGFKEVRLLDWNSALVDFNFTYVEFVIDANFLNANGLVFSQDMAILFRNSIGAFLDPLLIDSVSVTAAGGNVHTMPYVIDFFGAPWNGFGNGVNALTQDCVQDRNDALGLSSDVFLKTGAVQSDANSPTGPCDPGAPGPNYFAWFDDNPNTNYSNVQMLSGAFALETVESACLSFCVSSFASGSPANSLFVDLMRYTSQANAVANVSASITTLVGPIQSLGSAAWQNFNAPIGGGGNTFTHARLRFRANMNNGAAVKHNFYVDDVEIRACPGVGQKSSQTGFLDLNFATNTFGLPVSSLDFGPYYAVAGPGTVSTLTVHGNPFTPVLLALGELSINSLVFPGVGQLDINPLTATVISDPAGQPSLLGPLFTDALGNVTLQIPLPAGPPIGVVVTLQAVVFSSGTPTGAELTNAVVLSLL